MAVALGANLGDPLATLLAVRPLLAAELRGWWRELLGLGHGWGPERAQGPALGSPRGLGMARDRGEGTGGSADGAGVGASVGDGLGDRDGECASDGAERSGTPRLRWSPLFRTAPVGGPAGQPDYLNAVVVIDGGPPPSGADRPGLAGSPPGVRQSAPPGAIARAGTGFEPDAGAALALLRRLQRLEQRFGRVRTEPWGPRSLDLDLLWCGPQQQHLHELQLPHPRLRERAFVLTPLMAIDPELVVPGPGIWPPPPTPDALPPSARARPPAAGEGAVDGASAAGHPAATAATLLAALSAMALEPRPQRLVGRQGWPE